MINYNSVYVVFLVFVIAGVYGATMMDIDDNGGCKRSTTGGLAVREPNSQSFIDSEFCIWVMI